MSSLTTVGRLYLEYVDIWRDASGGAIAFFNDTARAGRYGDWELDRKKYGRKRLSVKRAAYMKILRGERD